MRPKGSESMGKDHPFPDALLATGHSFGFRRLLPYHNQSTGSPRPYLQMSPKVPLLCSWLFALLVPGSALPPKVGTKGFYQSPGPIGGRAASKGHCHPSAPMDDCLVISYSPETAVSRVTRVLAVLKHHGFLVN